MLTIAKLKRAVNAQRWDIVRSYLSELGSYNRTELMPLINRWRENQ